MDSLVGLHIKSFSLSEDGSRMELDTNKGPATIVAYGDCCSVSYIEDLDNSDALFDAEVISIDEIEGEAKTVDDEEVHEWTFYKIKTNKGMCTISMRNESNGYYGGWLSVEFTGACNV